MSSQIKTNGISDRDYHSLINKFNAAEDSSLLGGRLDQLFEKIVDSFPNNTALIHRETSISFSELNASANVLARGLIKRGLKHGDVVGLAVSRSIDLITVILAVLKLGAAYVPIDPLFPAERINQMVSDASPKLILLSGTPSKGLASWIDLCMSVDEAREHSITDVSNIEAEIQPHDLSYVIYTSGSTGRPKGVEISHGAAANFLSSLRKYEPGCNEHDILLAITTISFDMSALELLLPLVSGTTMVIADTTAVKDPRELLGLIKRHRVTILQATPATWTMLLESGWNGNPRLSKIICGGEPLTRQLADRLLASADSVWNVYGPSETTYGSVGRVGEGDIVVGNPVVNGRIYVLDDNLSPAPIGHEGEIYIGGGSVSNGYRNNVELTRARFLANPFHGGRFFRTGDLGRFLAPGKLQVVGRIDGVVKIRGHRIDVGDIEAVLVDHASISAAVVISHDDRLVAYCVLDKALSGTVSLDTLLRPWVADRLPNYMLPAFFVQMDVLPLSPNEKVNRKALPNPIEAIQSQASKQPTSELEQQLLAIWSDILGHNRIGIEDNFFNLGGDSVRVIRMQAVLERLLHRPIPTPKLFEHYTIKTLAAYLADMGKENGKCESQVAGHGLTSSNEDIAVISMACRLPGGVTTPEDFWQLLQSGRDAVIDVPKDRWDADKIYDTNPDVDGTSYCRRGGFLDSIYSYDASFFGISPREARAMDPAQNLMLELCWEGFERAGYTKKQLRGSTTGVFIGVSSNGTTSNIPPDLKGYSITGSASATISGRLSYILGLEGPSLVVDTACSSSLVATHLACNALRHGECDMALVGGLRGLSTDGHCRAFSDDTDGTGFSEGATVMVLKRLSDAQRDGDHVCAVLRGTAVMHGGYSAGLTVPSGPGQVKLIRTALGRVAMEPSDIDYIEAHGTATKLGDPIEATALAEVFGVGRSISHPLRLGSAKSNIGHTQAAAGLAGLLKVVLSMQNNVLPKTLHISKPTRKVDWESANIELVLTNQPWLPSDSRPRRAGVSAFGIGGTNAHVIVEESPRPILKKGGYATPLALPVAIPFLLSGHSDFALRAQAEKLRLHVGSGIGKDNCLSDIAYSLATARTHFQRRVVVVASDKAQLLGELASVSSGSGKFLNGNEVGKASVGILFTGQGSQRLGMGKDLYAVYPVFRNILDNIAALFSGLESPLLDIMWAEPGSTNASLLNRTDFTQAALFALEVSLWGLWQSWGVHPDYILGHSVGEIVAAHVAGVLSLPDACQLVMMRGRLMQALPSQGKMASIEASSIEVETTIKELGQSDKVEIGAYNTPSQVVISGDSEAVDAVAVHMAKLGRKTKVLGTSHAFHSSHMDDMLDNFRAVAQNLQFNPPKIPIISSMTGELAKVGELQQAEYWVQQARNAVRFSDAFQELAKQGANVFLELGPSPTLCGLGASCLTDTSQVNTALWLPSLRPDVDAISVIQNSINELHTRHVAIDWSEFFKPFGCQRVGLPTYAFQRESFQPAEVPNLFGNLSRSCDTPGAINDVESMMFEINWRPVSTNKSQTRGTWGLLYPSNETAWMKMAQNALSNTGVKLVPVTKPQEAKQLDGVLSLWDSNADVIQMAHSFTATALAHLQEVSKTGFAAPVVWVTRHAVGAGTNDQPTGIGAGPLWGLMRTTRSEHPELRLHLIDIGDDTSFDALGMALMLDNQAEIAIRKGQLLVPHLERATMLPTPVGQPLLRTDGAVLVTGGLGDLGGRVSRRLVSCHGVRDVVIMSRHGMESLNAGTFVAELGKLGAKVTIIGGDVADLDSLKSVMKLFTADRPLRGVIHAAGVVDSGILSSLTPQKCSTTFAPKVDGLWNLHELTKDMDLDVFMMFSSISGIMGLPGLGNYAAANSFIDVLAHLRRAQGLPATSVAYGVWGGDGMATTLLSTTRAHLSQLGLGFLSPEDGLKLFEQAVHQGRTLTVAAVLDLERLRSYYEEQGGVPSFLCSILGQNKAKYSVDTATNLRNMLIDSAPEQHGSIMLRTVQGTIAKALGYTRMDDIDASQPLKELGVDSLTAVLVRNHLATLTGMVLPPNIALLRPNLIALSEFLLSQLQNDIGIDSYCAPKVNDIPKADGAPSSNGAPKANGVPKTNGVSKINGVSKANGETKANGTVPNNIATASYVDMAAINRGVLDPRFHFENIIKHPTTCFNAPSSVFVTGPTGFVGAFMVYEFLKRSISVYCLVRASSPNLAQERVIKTLRKYSLWKPEYEPLLNSVAGDLSQPLLGLHEDVFNDIANRADAILHSGALVDWMRPLEDYIGPNILGTHEILRLASRGRGKAVHFISTISTLPIHVGYGLTELDGEYGYGTSKYLAEKMIVAARFRGAAASSYRLPFVAASATNGRFRLDRGDFLNNLITGSLDLGAFPSLNSSLSSVLPVDYLCNTIATIMTEDQGRIGEDYDFINPHAPTFDHFFGIMGVASGNKVTIPFSDWHRRALEYAIAHPKGSLARITTILDGYTDETAGALMKGSPIGKHVLGLDIYPVPLMDEGYVHKYLNCITAAKEENGHE
ncbi:polyketide synthase [Microsporum canis CBS 113480]|uniref:Polyketide synthase n=1 Tax=Arthroderma otae (strain ATCC MYA-4605 / CBS 113480) TaxID=554155 RepID=C5FE73_ARTOC|nr:polyketide synthase [Microsporum canis CBS 113480]EEQ28107.1 polyketide synthase [Microsporum canis CBS 113480]